MNGWLVGWFGEENEPHWPFHQDQRWWYFLLQHLSRISIHQQVFQSRF